MFSGLRWDWVGNEKPCQPLTFAQTFVCLKATDKNRTLCLISLPQISSLFTLSCGVEFHSENGKNYIVQSEILTISLQERKVIKNDFVPAVFQNTRRQIRLHPCVAASLLSQFSHLCRSSSQRHLFPCIRRHHT